MKSIMNKIYSYFYSNFVQRFYKPICETDNNRENIYRRKNKLVVFVNNKEIGQQIYSTVKSLKDRKDRIYTSNTSFGIAKYIASNGEIQAFSIKFYLEEDWDRFSNLEKLQELVEFIRNMQKKGYILDGSRFEVEKCNNISTFLSFFQLGNKEVKSSEGYLVKYIHYILSKGGNLNEFYQEIVNNGICSVSSFPYNLPVITMCYNYFITGNVEEDIYVTLKNEKNNDVYSHLNYLIANRGCLNSKFVLNESNNEYSIYDGNIKIYHKVSFGFKNFLLDYIDTLRRNNKDYCIEQIDNLIIDFDGNIIGYKFRVEESQKIYTIFNKKFESQGEILNFVFEASNYLFNLYNTLSFRAYKEEENNFDIEKSLIYYNGKFSIINIKEVYNLATSEPKNLYNQLTIVFFKFLLTYLTQKYGQMSNEEQFLEKIEVRFLSPVITKEFINYALQKQVYYKVVEEFYIFLYETRKSTVQSSGEVIFYDSRFEYNPIQKPFIFEDEVKSKYGIEIKKAMTQTLTDGRILVTFNRTRKVSKVKDKEKSLRNEILEKLGDIEDNNVKIVGISEIIYSKYINIDNMHNVIGYITEPIKGQQLTDNVLLNLTNKDFIKVAGYMFSKFSKYYIPWEKIWMDNNFIFYINILDENFQIKACRSVDSNVSFVNWIIQHFLEEGYNSNAFVELNFSGVYHQNLKGYLVNLANSFNAYCDEHGIYYDNTTHKGFCPICKKTKYFVPYDFGRKASKILEDEYAEHYRIDADYNLKIYKKAFADIKQIESNVDKIISDRIKSKELNLGQNCFIPYKKAFDIKKRFVGYVYEATQFGDYETDINICNDIKDSQALKNLPRLMSLIRLILQIKEIIKRNLGFINNPFSHVFLSKSHKKQVQILNIEFLTEKGSKKGIIKDTIKWTCEYVCEILSLDTSIEIDFSDCSTDLDAILLKLQALSKDMTKYCAIHNMYYTKNYLFCPKCVENCQINNLDIKEVEKEDITKKNQINEGGESYIYSYDEKSVVKVFKDEVNYDLKGIVITRVLAKKDILQEINNKNLKYKYIIPQKIVVDKESNKIFGYVMDKVSGMPLSSLRDKAEVEKLGITIKDVFEILIAVGEGIENLHANNIYIGDLNGRNILFDTEKNVYFLDFDGMGVDNIAPEFCTDGYIDPVSKKNQNITMKDDWYSFAVQAFYYLTFTHPFNGIYAVKENGKKVILDIPDKMERRISLLGNHGMKPPAIARSWDWMNNELKMVFFNIFEKDTRKSIVPYLIRQYENWYIRVNPKFTAKTLELFDKEVVYVINHYSAVCKKDDKHYVNILDPNNKKNDLANLRCQEYRMINNILLSDDKSIAFAIYSDEIVAVILKTGDIIYRKAVSKTRDAVVNGNTLYYTAVTEEGDIILKTEILPTGEVQEEKIKFLPKQRNKRFCAKFNSKFIVVKCALDNIHEIYCNSQKLCDISYNYEDSEYNIIYDKAGKSWLVVNSEGNGIVINELNGTYLRLNIQESINNSNIENISFDRRMIYIPNQDCLHIVNTNGQITTKKMECNKIMTPNSKLYNINTEGFSVITDNMLYEVRRG